MSATVVDKLIVELGLDPKNFTKGTKEAAAAIVDTEKKTNTAANNMVASLRRVTAEFVSLFIAIKSVRDVVGVFQELNASTRQLGIDSKNTDESAAALKNLGNIAEIVGGKADDAAGTILGLQKAVFNAQHGLGWSDQLTEFGRIGVDTGANTGQLRPVYDLLRETSKALEEQYPDRAQRFQETQVLGLQGGIGQLVAGGVKEFDRLWKEQLSIPQVTQGQTGAAQRLTESWDVLKQRVEAELRKVLTAITPALQKLFRGIGDFIAKHSQDITRGIQELLGWFSGPGPGKVIDALVEIGDAAVSAAKFINALAHPFSSGALAGQTGKFSDSRLGKWLEKKADEADFGIRQNRAERAAGIPEGVLSFKGLPQDVAPERLAGDLAKIHAKLGGDAGDPNWNKTIEYFNQNAQFSGSVPDAAKATAGAGTSPRAQSALAGANPIAMNAGGRSGTTVSIDEVNVYTQATDASGIARDINGALNRKLTVSLVDGALS